MKRYDTEERLDGLLSYLAGRGSRSVVALYQLPEHFHYYDLRKLLDMLAHRGYIAYLTADFDDGPHAFHDVVGVTEAGIWFSHHSGFVKEAKQKRKETKRTNFETFKMGWDTVISLIALGISVVAILVALS